MRIPGLLGVMILLVSGCLGPDSQTSMVAPSQFPSGEAPATRARASFAQPSTAVAARVDTIGRNILAANAQSGIRPLFRTIGVTQLEVFHSGTSEVDITEGLVKQCASDGQVAAILCQELGKMVAEREASADTKIKVPQAEPPMDVRVGHDGDSAYGAADQTRLAELAKFEQSRRRQAALAVSPPDPVYLGRLYLARAGFNDADYTAVVPLLQTVSTGGKLEQQLTGPAPPLQSWVR
jgi:hypothetical protein